MSAAKIALGTVAFGSRIPESEVRPMLVRAKAIGIDMIDCANAYGDGLAESLIGDALLAEKIDLPVTTKVGLLRQNGRSEGLAPERILKACDESLGRLKRDAIDLYYFHVPDRRVPLPESLGAMKELLASKKVKAYGFSNYASWEILEAIHEADRLGMQRPSAAQQIYNLLIRELDVEFFRFARRYDVETSVFSVLAGGLLGRDHTRETIPKGSRFDGNPRYERRFWTEAFFARRDELRALADTEGLALATFAHAWAFHQDGVDRVIVGPTRSEELDEIARARDHELSKPTQKAIEALHERWRGTDTHYARA